MNNPTLLTVLDNTHMNEQKLQNTGSYWHGAVFHYWCCGLVKEGLRRLSIRARSCQQKVNNPTLLLANTHMNEQKLPNTPSLLYACTSTHPKASHLIKRIRLCSLEEISKVVSYDSQAIRVDCRFKNGFDVDSFEGWHGPQRSEHSTGQRLEPIKRLTATTEIHY